MGRRKETFKEYVDKNTFNLEREKKWLERVGKMLELREIVNKREKRRMRW